MTPKPEITITITARFDGFATELCFSGQLDQLPAVTRRIRELGGEPIAPHTAPLAKAKAERVQPFYDGDGQACCPKHKKALKEGKWGLYCPAKDDSTERGYCALKFED
jgi:hypothetical protein